jgi:hypothetical protein
VSEKAFTHVSVLFRFFLQGVLVLQDQYRATIQYSFTKDSDGQWDKMPTDWYCNCGVFNFKRRDNCFKCSASREESEKGGEGSDEISNILTKSEWVFSCLSLPTDFPPRQKSCSATSTL